LTHTQGSKFPIQAVAFVNVGGGDDAMVMVCAGYGDEETLIKLTLKLKG
jgi:hypothetical protein